MLLSFDISNGTENIKRRAFFKNIYALVDIVTEW